MNEIRYNLTVEAFLGMLSDLETSLLVPAGVEKIVHDLTVDL